MNDLIDRQAAIDVLKALEKPAPTARHLSAIFDCEDAIKALPSAEPERTASAPWNTDRNRYCCDSCGAYIGKYDKYCNGCGARLTDWTPDGRGKRK